MKRIKLYTNFITLAILLCVILFSLSCSLSSNNIPPKKTVSTLEYIKVGEIIPEINTKDLNGKMVAVASRQDKEGQLVVIYSPSCAFCRATIPRWEELYNQFFSQQKIPVIALSVQNNVETAKSIQEMKIPFKVVEMTDIESQLGYKIPTVPITLALASDGTIKNMWVGKLEDYQLVEIIKAFCKECDVNINVK